MQQAHAQECAQDVRAPGGLCTRGVEPQLGRGGLDRLERALTTAWPLLAVPCGVACGECRQHSMASCTDVWTARQRCHQSKGCALQERLCLARKLPCRHEGAATGREGSSVSPPDSKTGEKVGPGICLCSPRVDGVGVAVPTVGERGRRLGSRCARGSRRCSTSTRPARCRSWRSSSSPAR